MSWYKGLVTHWGRIRGKRGCRTLVRRRARPALEQLEFRLTPSVGGGWISSTQSGQSGDGLLGQYYNNSTLSGTPSFTRWDDRVDFSSPGNNSDPGGSPDPAFASVGPDNWSAEWTGTLTANFSETYTFQINSAGNGVRLWVTPVGQQQGNPIINDWTAHGQTTDTATMTLQAGQDYNVELEYSQTSASVQQVQLQWSSPSTPLEDIEPATQVGLNVDGGDALFANMVNGGTRSYWWVPGNTERYGPDRQQSLARSRCRDSSRGRGYDHRGRGILPGAVHRNGDRVPTGRRTSIGGSTEPICTAARFKPDRATIPAPIQPPPRWLSRQVRMPAFT